MCCVFYSTIPNLCGFKFCDVDAYFHFWVIIVKVLSFIFDLSKYMKKQEELFVVPEELVQIARPIQTSEMTKEIEVEKKRKEKKRKEKKNDKVSGMEIDEPEKPGIFDDRFLEMRFASIFKEISEIEDIDSVFLRRIGQSP
ncbi:hypothetical protein L6452_17219 [Arctium lappa]|uniref:Uncharacterized protein n=1 Tax=Arctium lappa TaxID=4217 RepID=A0ACB9C2P2_ARCLA|nr:hypothetical protein L6452_17219 [Arctium lappa]